MTELEGALIRAGFLLSKDAVGVWHVRLGDLFFAHVDRFSRLQNYVALHLMHEPYAVVACLLCFDGVLGTQSLNGAVKALQHVYRHDNKVVLEWAEEQPQRVERRHLSGLSTQALGHMKYTFVDAMPTVEQACEWLKSVLLKSQLYKPGGDIFEQLWVDSFCWHVTYLPSPLWGHVARLQVMSALPREALARQVSEKILKSNVDLDEDTGAVEIVLDAIRMAKAPAKDTLESSNAMKMLEKIMARNSKLSDAQQRKVWVKQLLQVLDTASQCGPTSCLVLAWALDLAESGTPLKSDAAASTIQSYVRAIMWPLWKVFHKLFNQEQKTLEETYRDMYAELMNCSEWRHTSACINALSSWHKFLVRELDAPGIRGLGVDLELDSQVDAQVIWPHEKRRALDALQYMDSDPRLRDALLVFFHLACNGAFRSGELMRLRIANVIFNAGNVYIEITGSLKYGRLKTEAAQRRVRITDPHTVQVASAWVERRIQEKADFSSLLFGDPQAASLKVYRGYEMVRLVNRALKMATGCKSSSIHGLRHTFLTQAMLSTLEMRNVSSLNRFWEIANDAGHVSARTTFISYTHRYESALRLRLDEVMRCVICWTSKSAASLLELKDATLRQQAARQGCQYVDLLDKHWQKLPDLLQLPTVDQGIELTDYVFHPLSATQSQFGILDLMQLLGELAGDPKSLPQDYKKSLALRYQISEEMVALIEKTALAICNQIFEKHSSRFKNLVFQSAVFNRLNSALHAINVDWSRYKQEKYKPLKQYLQSDKDIKLLQQVASQWGDYYKNKYMALDERGNDMALLWLLRLAGVANNVLQVRAALYRSSDQKANWSNNWRAIFGELPQVLQVAKRTDRPAIYLCWTGAAQQLEEGAYAFRSAAVEVAGLAAWLIGISVWVQLSSKEVANAL